MCSKYYCTQLSCHLARKVVEKFRFSELKIEKVQFFAQSPIPKVFALINIVNVRGCSASCLTYTPFLKLDP